METETGRQAKGEERGDAAFGLESPGARLVCMYLDRVPAAYADEIERDLQLPRTVLEPVLRSLVEYDVVRERDGLYVLSVEPTD
jgi:hypothetical protein